MAFPSRDYPTTPGGRFDFKGHRSASSAALRRRLAELKILVERYFAGQPITYYRYQPLPADCGRSRYEFNRAQRSIARIEAVLAARASRTYKTYLRSL